MTLLVLDDAGDRTLWIERMPAAATSTPARLVEGRYP